MAATVVVDAGFLVTLISRDDADHRWASEIAERFPPPWKTCEAVLSETFFLVRRQGTGALATLLRRGSVMPTFQLADNVDAVLRLMGKYADVPMSFADACLVRMTEVLPDSVLLTTDSDFRIYRRNGRQVVPCVLPR